MLISKTREIFFIKSRFTSGELESALVTCHIAQCLC
jgi:hypothetical protein